MPREVDKRKTRKALRRLKRVADRAEDHVAEGGKDLSAWEKDFLAGVAARLETYGSAFRDLSKGAPEEAMSRRQVEVTRVIEKKTRPKAQRQAAPSASTPDREAQKPRKALRRTPFRRKGQTPPARSQEKDDNLPE